MAAVAVGYDDSMPVAARSEKVISIPHHFIWIGVPKAATRSLLTALVRNPSVDLGATEVTDPLSKLLREHPEYEAFYKFTFVRNPWARVVSTYLDKVVNANERKIRAILSKFPGLTPEMSFHAFVDFLTSPDGSDERADRHWLSQHRFLVDEHGEIATDFIGRTERLQEEFAEVMSRLGLPEVQLPHLNSRLGWQPSRDQLKSQDQAYYRDFYDRSLRAAVASRYQRDIELLGYEF